MTLPLSLQFVREKLAVHPHAHDSDAPGWRAAVAAIIRESPEAPHIEILLIKRAEHPQDPWSGHMAFPGGRSDPDDVDLHQTALRETREEIGIDLQHHATMISRLPDLPAIANGRSMGVVIAPFVFAVERALPAFVPDPNEVAQTVWVPLDVLLRREGAGTMLWHYKGRDFEVPCIRFDDKVIWGLTYQMLLTLLARLES